jgi:hypothetical protein
MHGGENPAGIAFTSDIFSRPPKGEILIKTIPDRFLIQKKFQTVIPALPGRISRPFFPEES